MKVLEIRDRATYIPVVAFKTAGESDAEQSLFKSVGLTNEHLILVKLSDCTANYSSFRWDRQSRTMRVAHDYINAHWNNIKSGDVVDIEYILKETVSKKMPQRRVAYLEEVSRNMDIPIEVVTSLAENLGPDEDYDGLISVLGDY